MSFGVCAWMRSVMTLTLSVSCRWPRLRSDRPAGPGGGVEEVRQAKQHHKGSRGLALEWQDGWVPVKHSIVWHSDCSTRTRSSCFLQTCLAQNTWCRPTIKPVPPCHVHVLPQPNVPSPSPQYFMSKSLSWRLAGGWLTPSPRRPGEHGVESPLDLPPHPHHHPVTHCRTLGQPQLWNQPIIMNILNILAKISSICKETWSWCTHQGGQS